MNKNIYSNPSNTLPYYSKLFLIILISTIVWVTVTLMTKPAEKEKLIDFYKRTNPGGFGWRPIEAMLDDPPESVFKENLLNFFYGVVLVIGFTMGSGKLLLGYYASGSLYTLAGLISSFLIYNNLKKSKKVFE